jgi:hypothetical protein
VKFFICLLITTTSFATFAQLVEFPLGHHAAFTSVKQSKSARTQSTPLTLPFWDDFSYSDTLTYPQENLWLYGKSVYLNNGIGIHAPSKNVVTFDGVDSLGGPYNVNDRVAKGFADRLVSQPIRMDLVDPALRNTVYLSFYYQMIGNGEAPDNGDNLTVDLLNTTGTWETVRIIEPDTIDSQNFFQVLIPISNDRFFHAAFQFRFRNSARLSGPYDTWNVDYVYLNSGRSATDTSYPDRTVSSNLNSLFNLYYAMPYKHFLQNSASKLKHPSLLLYNLRQGNLQPFDYSTHANLTQYHGTSNSKATIPLDVAQAPGSILTGLQFLNLTLNKIPNASVFDPKADSVDLQLKFQMTTKDNVLPPPIDNGDYDPSKYSPIDFRVNDVTSIHYKLSKYYAYDDGSAEYGAGFNRAGSFLAFKFPIQYSQSDTLIAVDIYFPNFGDNTSQSLILQVRTNLSGDATSVLYGQSIQVNRTSQNKFTRYPLESWVLVKDTVILGWKQLTNVSIAVGLDKNNDNGDKIFYNTNGAWIKNTSVKGSIMVRPVFGKGKGNGIITGLEPQSITRIYPNPASRICYLPQGAVNISTWDITGRSVETELQSLTDRQSLTFISPVSGLVIIHYFIDGKAYAEKIMVRGE